MRVLFIFFLLVSVSPFAGARSYAFTLENSFAQSAIVAEVQVTSSRIYVSDFHDFEEVEIECKVLTLFKGPANLASFRLRYYAKSKPTEAKALVFAFRPSNVKEIRAFNGSGGFVGGKDNSSSSRFEKLKAELAALQKSGAAKPMEGFAEGTLEGAVPLEPGTLTFSTIKD